MSAVSPLSPAPARSVGTFGVFVAGVSLVVSASTLVTEFMGFTTFGGGFAVSLLLGFCIVVPVALAVADLAVAHPYAGGIYRLVRAVIGHQRGKWAGMFLGLCFLGTFFFGAAGETMAGAHAAKSLSGQDLPVGVFAAGISVLALAAGLLPLRRLTQVAGGLLVFMLGIRWFFGLAGFFGWSDAGEWSLVNLQPGGDIAWLGQRGLLAGGLTLGFWSFVGIEGASALAGETRRPARSIPRGMILGLAAILATSLVAGLGAIGTLPVSVWQEVVRGELGHGGASPQLAVGELMFGGLGRTLMAISSLASCLSTLVVAFAAVPRVIHAMARDGLFFGPCSAFFSRLHPRTGVPVRALLLVGGIYLGVTIANGAVLECLKAAAYLWFFRYFVLYALAIVNRVRRPGEAGALSRPELLMVASVGIALTVLAFQVAFAGRHVAYGGRALAVLGGAGFLTFVCCLSGGELLGRLAVWSREVWAARPGFLATAPTNPATAP